MIITCAFLLGFSSSAAAADTGEKNVTLSVANDNGVKYNINNNNTYTYFPGNGSGTGAIKITSNVADIDGDIVFTGNQSGTFYVTDTGGQGWDDTVILMLAVNGTIPDNFALNILVSGYQWTPSFRSAPTGPVTYKNTALDETFYKSDFSYGPQIYKPMNTPVYPIYQQQDTNNLLNQFYVMFIDLYAGIWTNTSLTDRGMVKIVYSFENLPQDSMAAFNAYGFKMNGTNNQRFSGIQWTNLVNKLGENSTIATGFYVNGAAPVAGFSVDPKNGQVPLNVQFTDKSTGKPTSWLWDFGDGTTSDDQNPNHTYRAPGTYKVILTVTNAAGNSTYTSYITVSGAPVDNKVSAQSNNIPMQNTGLPLVTIILALLMVGSGFTWGKIK